MHCCPEYVFQESYINNKYYWTLLKEQMRCGYSTASENLDRQINLKYKVFFFLIFLYLFSVCEIVLYITRRLFRNKNNKRQLSIKNIGVTFRLEFIYG